MPDKETYELWTAQDDAKESGEAMAWGVGISGLLWAMWIIDSPLLTMIALGLFTFLTVLTVVDWASCAIRAAKVKRELDAEARK